ncbi:hypothetical protein DENSPDRAFT_849542 [Dentipellis sp. KUC8613]|nr:hypothetical protein DENSPDRAFT_849542 [Dentipellis sp. KUC8613]
MNSYPPELLAQLAPLMFVAGLDIPPPTNPPDAPPTPSTPSTPSSAQIPPGTPKPAQDPFTVLMLRLRDALLSQRKPAIWQPEKSKTFQVVLVDKEARFPPRKLLPADDTNYANAHSPLSPLTHSSPLHPDGIIAPIWVRKHTALVPSVFVLFMRLYESPPIASRSPLDAFDPERIREREEDERRRDAELSAEVAKRKRTTNERGIKLTVVLIASRKMLDDPALDTRLTFIRRQSGLDSRAALFVLSPVSPAELNEFVKSLQQALYEPAVEYYTSHSKRVRRKRNRHTQTSTSYINPLSPVGTPSVVRPLRPEGWTVRYEFKMACFAEFRGEDEVALKHYQDAYSTLNNMFGSTAILPPRTKRWAEAKVLADCINIKICKLYLYNNEHSLALSQHNIHMRKFSDFSRGWGIGEETFEFWSWIARQHRVFAELLEQGTRASLKLPSNTPVKTPSTAALAASQMQLQAMQRGAVGVGMGNLEVDALRLLGLNPAHALQHPGFYYYMGARATEKRRARFLAMLENSAQSNNSPGFVNEKKVDHLTIILELYTKSYELFRKYSTSANGQGRLTLRIADRIAQTYSESGKFDMAVRFFERIARTYRREKWRSMLQPLLSTWYSCAQKLGDMELSVKLLVEMLAYGSATGTDEDGSIEEDLLAVLRSTVPSTSDEPLAVDLSESEPIFDTSVIFWKSTASVNERIAFQISISVPPDVSLSSLPFSSLAIYFSHRTEPVMIYQSTDAPSAEIEGGVQCLDLGEVLADAESGSSSASGSEEGEESEKDEGLVANLRWGKGSTVVFTGTVASEVPTTLQITRAVLTLTEARWAIEIPIDFSNAREGIVRAPRWLTSTEPVTFVPIRRTDYSEVVVNYKPHQIEISFSHHAPALLDEEYPIVIDVTNLDDRPLEVVLDVLLQPTEIDEAINDIRIDDERSTGLIKGVDLGSVAPGATVLKTLYLTNTGAGGDRILDVSIQSRAPGSLAPPISPLSPTAPEGHAGDTSERLQTLVIPTVGAMKAAYDVRYRHAREGAKGLLDLRTYGAEGEWWDEWEGGEAEVKVVWECVGPWSVSVEKVRLVRKNGSHAKVMDCSLDEDEDDIASEEWLPGDKFAAHCRISMTPEDDLEEGDAITGPGEYELTWRRTLPDDSHGPLCKTFLPLPLLRPPKNNLTALISLPSTAHLHTPFQVTLTLRNHSSSLTADLAVHLDTDAADAFFAAGLRSARVPLLLPGAEESVCWMLIPVECGWARVPKIRVVDRRRTAPDAVEGKPSEEGVEMRIVDVRREGRDEKGEDVGAGAGAEGEERSVIGPILVLP